MIDDDELPLGPSEPGLGAEEPNSKTSFVPAFDDIDPVRLVRSLAMSWRAVTDWDSPTYLQIAQGRIQRVDVDLPTGYVAVVTPDDTHRAIGLRREAIVPLVASLTGRTRDEVTRALSEGPAMLTSIRTQDLALMSEAVTQSSITADESQ
ncbi:MAG: hypothetical protein Q8Q09_12470 [Deltaproteobacteria bacterium]|nr:hypothetical protein [Deltaproteobacteria bacterium]